MACADTAKAAVGDGPFASPLSWPMGDGNLAARLLLRCLAFFLRTIGFPCPIVEAVTEGSESMQNREGVKNEEEDARHAAAPAVGAVEVSASTPLPTARRGKEDECGGEGIGHGAAARHGASLISSTVIDGGSHLSRAGTYSRAVRTPWLRRRTGSGGARHAPTTHCTNCVSREPAVLCHLQAGAT
jgi:hypothetical protein